MKKKVLYGKLGYDGQKPNEKEEVIIITKPKANALSDLDFVVKAFKFAGRNVEGSMGDQAIEPLFLLCSKANQCRNAALFSSSKPIAPASIGSDRIEQEKQSLADQQTQLEAARTEADRTEQFLALVRKYRDCTELTDEMIHAIVDKIVVHRTSKAEATE